MFTVQSALRAAWQAEPINNLLSLHSPTAFSASLGTDSIANISVWKTVAFLLSMWLALMCPFLR